VAWISVPRRVRERTGYLRSHTYKKELYIKVNNSYSSSSAATLKLRSVGVNATAFLMTLQRQEYEWPEEVYCSVSISEPTEVFAASESVHCVLPPK